ncbi:hypothetical protein [Salisediminibacterium selenitireducens]|uniref:Uncharacterized protein n=1 Tax=Bacillus selenitireducens (strain ATCC 700615 / DSM 15326 / MLS10) TaxID=439292 RepID=D6XSJ2_BACIE|nr:hypothetical protein [Salisediminibacterium selenitireducens]ADH98778.1 hypothetical protein Bsel_1266 [[Bacillus] selenitireducens MLS10]
MKDKKMEFVIDADRVRAEQEKRLVKLFTELYDDLFSYIEYDTNLREKVRAKHTYRYRTGLPDHFPLPEDEMIFFQEWFAFDYVTVSGARIFDLFVRNNQGVFNRQMLELAGVLMLMHLQPVRITGKNSKHLLVSPAFEAEKEWHVESNQDLAQLNTGDLIFTRITQVGSRRLVVGTPFTIAPEQEAPVLEKLSGIYQQGDSSFRKYMKEFGIDFRKYAL